jgi:hypothetical protein
MKTAFQHIFTGRALLGHAVCITALLLMLGAGHAGELVINKGVIDKDTVWQGEILLKGDVEVAENATLIIMPGTTVRFAKIKEFGPEKLSDDKLNHFPRAELIIRGHLYAQGTLGNEITFTSADPSPTPGDWGAVNFLGSVDNIMEFCVFTYAHTAVHCHSAQVVVSYCTFHHNGVAIGQKNAKGMPEKCVVPIMYNWITENGGGVLFGGGSSPTVAHNEIHNNTFFGIYAKKGGLANVRYNNITNNGKGVIFYAVKDIVLRDNNIADNLDYNISLLDGQATDIKARNNWWGTTDADKIKTSIRDKARDDSLGTVDFADYLKGPVKGAGLIW